MVEIVECLDAQGRSPYQRWFYSLDPQAAAIVTVAIERLADGNTSRVKSIGEGVAEIRIDRGPGYRIYFGWDGKALVVLLGGGTKRRQQHDIAEALALWRLYQARKATGRRR
ncbi:MAG: type II toxin-antitoxin system RelE/ParE family toxin [Xanthobacteraceae bacterium]